MAHCFPYLGNSAQLHQKPEETREDKWQLGKIVSVDVHGGKQTDNGSSADNNTPVPLPSPSNGIESLCDGEVEAAVSIKRDDGQDKSDAEENSETNRSAGPFSDAINGRPTPCCVDEGAIGHDKVSDPRFPSQKTPRAIGEGLVCE